MVISLDEFRRQKEKVNAMQTQARYDDDLLCVNWNPAVAAVAAMSYQRRDELSPDLPDDFSTIDVTELMLRVRALATQI